MGRDRFGKSTIAVIRNSSVSVRDTVPYSTVSVDCIELNGVACALLESNLNAMCEKAVIMF